MWHADAGRQFKQSCCAVSESASQVDAQDPDKHTAMVEAPQKITASTAARDDTCTSAADRPRVQAVTRPTSGSRRVCSCAILQSFMIHTFDPNFKVMSGLSQPSCNSLHKA